MSVDQVTSPGEIKDITYQNIRNNCIQLIIRQGNKSRAQRLWQKAMYYISLQEKSGELIVCNAFLSIAPVVECRKVRVAGSTVIVPKLVTPDEAKLHALRWLLQGAHRRNQGNFSKALAQEILEAFRGTGWAVSQRSDVHRLAEANRAYVRYQWWN